MNNLKTKNKEKEPLLAPEENCIFIEIMCGYLPEQPHFFVLQLMREL